MYRNKRKYIWIVIIASIIFFSLKTFNDYRERNLDELISYKPKDFYPFAFTKDREKVPNDRGYEWWTDEQETTEELLKFLAQYRVKRINEETYNVHLNSESFEFIISHSKANPAIVQVMSNNVHIFVGNYYEVLNGPIDMEWITNYNEKYLEKYGEN
ncbi:hypothetical protein [Sutcliffiella halmapala]|uniref:hypothetical protein n=1 Tax=Sutcliffiella halmapala TaxID=79882 RepID=UPI0009955C49|nr:hypothetical protein [Sutcliffiella halmapala]